jgi:5-methylthioadenosine/S-adenosylhomocysteine deaminase
MATIGGARALHMEQEIGSIEKGKRADLVIVDMDVLNQTPHYNIYSDLVYSSKAADVRTVIIEGRVVMRGGQLLTLNESEVKRKAREYRQRIMQSLAPAPTAKN